jgi:predicted alpha/beta hydrolase
MIAWAAALLAGFTWAKAVGLASALFGAGGTLILLVGSHAFEGFGLFETQAAVDAKMTRNAERWTKQRWGLGLILVSFLLQAVSLFFP